ncbi:hypothetical protein [Pseudomonas donghuensis]|uniref:hypothetical protein n=1 Tax=Pseudomonas donghuensis TaxID=1163398 RepID=UPI0020C54F5B|nr:hypothetical protein [Pseudomonas donghuensis]MCP6691325.1 hypothetical protein [Pseudomonas donghuensis]
MNKAVFTLAVGLALAGCGNADRERAEQLQGEVSTLQSEVSALKAELETERNGAPRLLARAKDAKAAGDNASAKTGLADLIARYPEKAEAAAARTLLEGINNEEKAAEKDRLAAEARKAEEARVAIEKLDKSLKKDTDEIKGVTWISHKSEPVLANYMSLYFGVKDGTASAYPLRMKFNYYADSWLFVETVTIKADDQVFNLNKMDFERDNAAGRIWEWSDSKVEDMAMLNKILSAKKVVVRYDGRQYYHDFVLPESQKSAMREMVLAWKRYGGKA